MAKNLRIYGSFLIIIIMLPLWLGGVKDLVTYLGLISAGLAIALQGLILDFVGWLFIYGPQVSIPEPEISLLSSLSKDNMLRGKYKNIDLTQIFGHVSR